MIQKQEEFNDQIKAIFSGGKINKIDWGGESENSGWNTWHIEKRLEYSMELAAAMNQAADILQKERNDIADQLQTTLEQLENAQSIVGIHKATLVNAITKNNEVRQEDAETIQSLKTKIEELEQTVKDLRQ